MILETIESSNKFKLNELYTPKIYRAYLLANDQVQLLNIHRYLFF
ncbi:MAG: hypothetical protein OXE77_11140 [Flavobacteriaceae bacterium]|nr:hypothetical protein [Flavobacteriaceae bacterium]MCY4268374.1 hypothetical protein [Flavobacteriaceae bacterium]MCY4298389.1 hypothetical protein [Flavobacteriaceae bacterium]